MNKSSDLAKEIRKIVSDEIAANFMTFIKEINALKQEVERLSKEPRINFNPTFNVPEQKMPVIKNEIRVEAPIIEPVFNVPEQKMPIIKNEINVEPAPVNPTPVQVNVKPELKMEKSALPPINIIMDKVEITKMPEREIKTVVLREEKTNRAKGTLTTEKDKSKE